MQAVEHRPGRQGNPDASRCLRRPPSAASPEDRSGDGECASTASAPRGPCVRHGCVGSGGPPRAARCRAPGSNMLVCSSADRGRSGCKAGPGQSTVRTGTSGQNRRYAPRGPSPRCWTDSSQRATLWWHRLHRHGVGCGAVDQPPSDGPLPCPTYFGIVVRCTAHALASVTAASAPQPAYTVSAHRRPLASLIAKRTSACRLVKGAAFACMAALRAAMQANNSCAQQRHHGTNRLKHRPYQNRVLTAEYTRFLIAVHNRPRSR